jgi:hypothetical protein
MTKTASHQPVFLTSTLSTGPMFDFRSDQHPAMVAGWSRSDLCLDDCGTHFGFVHSGRTTFSTNNGVFDLKAGMYFAVPGTAEIQGTGGGGFVASRIGYRGFFLIGGPIEQTGRLRYINDCTDSLLLGPVTKGDPCLNLLHIPPDTNQTAHTHPSLRIGMIVGGEGFCRTPEGNVPMTPGLVFVIRTGGLHSFHTREQSLRIVAWHPDSDFGPTHEHHPMRNRTLINGHPINATGEPQ